MDYEDEDDEASRDSRAYSLSLLSLFAAVKRHQGKLLASLFIVEG